MTATAETPATTTTTTTAAVASNSGDASSLESGLVVGRTRVRDADGFLGTVVYLGPVASAKNRTERYAGVEWDDPTRGKHDGTVVCRRTNELVRHFRASHATGGSFLRLSKMDRGVGLDLNIMTGRYVTQGARLLASAEDHYRLPGCYAMTTRGNTKPIELLGETKIRERQQLEDLTAISLRSMGIRGLVDEPSQELVELAKRYVEVDLGGNLLSDWDEVERLLNFFENVANISFASNRLLDIGLATKKTFQTNSFSNITILNLNKCGIKSFSTIHSVAKPLPNLQQLCIAYNDLSDLQNDLPATPISEDVFQHLTFLDCSHCQLDSWNRQVQFFSHLANLSSLILDDNNITTIPPFVANEHFTALRTLQIASNSIDDWSSVDALSRLPNLYSLRFRNNPITSDMGAGEARAITIARMGRLEHLNASFVSNRERTESERRYVRSVARELLMLTTATTTTTTGAAISEDDDDDGEDIIRQKKNEHLSHHPRFESLVKAHSESMVGVGTNTGGGGGLAQETVNVTLRSMASSSATMEPVCKRLPGSTTIGRLKCLCQRVFGLDAELQILHLSEKDSAFPTELDEDENTLAYYGVMDSSEILMNEVDLEADAERKRRQEEEYEKRLEMQERSGDLRRGETTREHVEYKVAASVAAKAV